MNLFTIPPGAPFLDHIASWWLARGADPLQTADGLILLPTRRAARALSDAFLRAAAGRPLLLPRIAAIGALDELPLALEGALDLPPAMPQTERLAAMTRLVMALDGRYGAPVTADRAWLLATELARLLDEAHREGVALHQVLPDLVPDALAAHWQDTLHFLQIVTLQWPEWLTDNGVIDPADRAVRLLRAQAAAWEAAPPAHPILVAGTAGGSRAVAELMRVVARLPPGRVVLPGLDLAMQDTWWDALDDAHPQAGLRTLLADMGAVRGDVQEWPGATPGPRAATLWTSLLPAAGLGEWRDGPAPEVQGLQRLEPVDQQEEALAVALVLREALEQPGAQAALVTPDRVLAARVAAELARFGVVVDDSAGEPLGETPPGAFLRLLAQSVADGLAPVGLLGVLKHPLAAFGFAPAEARQRARRLELACLRGPAPPPGIAGLRARLHARPDQHAAELVDRLEAALAPLLDIAAHDDAAPADALRALVAAAESCAATDHQQGAARLWALEEGEALATHLADLLDALRHLPRQPVRVLPGLLDASLAGTAVRSRRALRGRNGAEHPRVAILGLLEARLQSFDLVVLGSLTEAVWPPAADPGPWMSRPMRRQAGLASPEQALGEMAHDYAMLASAAPHVVLSCPARRDGAPAVPARWLVRLDAYLAGHHATLPRNPAAAWARMLDQPEGPPRPVRPPAPRPPVDLRPRRLSVTEVETWLRDPYAIHARHVLRLRALDGLEESVEHADFGNLVHAAIAEWLQGAAGGPLTAQAMRACMDARLDDPTLRPALVTWWRPRLHRIADWVAAEQERRRIDSPNHLVHTELSGTWLLPEARFELRGRADRVERRPDGTLAVLDYKTGIVPSVADVVSGRAPQLPLEAAMLAHGAFGPEIAGTVTELTYWRLTGYYVPGESRPAIGQRADMPAVVAEAERGLHTLIRRYDDPSQAYLSQPVPGAAPRYTDYAQLARVAEWSAGEEKQP